MLRHSRPKRLASRRIIPLNLKFRKTSSPSAERSRIRMLMEVWPKDDESSITLRLAPPLRLETDGSGHPTEVWLKEDEISDVALRLVPCKQGTQKDFLKRSQRRDLLVKGLENRAQGQILKSKVSYQTKNQTKELQPLLCMYILHTSEVL